jgi:hypothetical protein
MTKAIQQSVRAGPPQGLKSRRERRQDGTAEAVP